MQRKSRLEKAGDVVGVKMNNTPTIRKGNNVSRYLRSAVGRSALAPLQIAHSVPNRLSHRFPAMVSKITADLCIDIDSSKHQIQIIICIRSCRLASACLEVVQAQLHA